MKIITINNGKGGVGKTMLTLNMALDLKKRGFKVGVLDSDNKQQSLTLWGSDQADIDIFNVDLKDLNRSNIKKELSAYDFILVDGIPQFGQEVLNYFKVSDYILVPALPDQFSLIATQALVNAYDTYIKTTKDNKAQIGLVINQYMENSQNHKEFLSVLKKLDKEIITKLPRRLAFTPVSNSSVFDTKDNKAKNELQYLTDIILERLGV